MNDNTRKTGHRRNAAAIDVWENEGGSSGKASMNHHYGRRIEIDRSWTVYHVFTGVPARVDGDALVGLSRLDATDCMMSLNLNNTERRKARIDLPAFGSAGSEIVAIPS